MSVSAHIRDSSGRPITPSWFTAFAIALSLSVAAYAVARASLIPLTYDEAATYQWYVDADLLSTWNLSSANNHLLNTLLTRIAYTLAGGYELVLRAGNLIGLAVYLVFSFLTLHALPSRALAAAGFALLTLNPYLLEYFSLSRGYGLALGLFIAALYFLVRLITCGADDGATRSHLVHALACGAAAVAANFSVLSVYLSLWTVALGIGVSRHRQAGRATPGERISREKRAWRPRVLLAIVATVFSAVVLAQDRGLSADLYTAVHVRVVGLLEEELDYVTVERLQATERWRRTVRRGDTWRVESGVFTGRLRVELPVRSARNVSAINVTIGPATFRHTRLDPGGWNRRETADVVVLESRSDLALPRAAVPAMRGAINWAGDRQHAVAVAAAVGVVLAGLCVLAGALAAIGWLLVRTNTLADWAWRILSNGVLWVAVLAAAPAVVLTRGGQLTFGGREGLVRDTYTSLIVNSFHGQWYHHEQVVALLAIVAATALAFVLLAVRELLRGKLEPIASAAALLIIYLLTSAILLLQHAVLGTPFLAGRTALVHIPLFWTFAIFAASSLIELYRWTRVVVVMVFAATASVAALHVVAVANVSYVFDWPHDADTRQMLVDLRRTAASQPAAQGPITLGVGPMYYPVARFYASRSGAPAIEVVAAPSDTPASFLYVNRARVPTSSRVVATYSRSNGVLLQGDRD